MKKYYEEISILRGIAILLVLLGHSIIIGPINLHQVLWCKTLYNYIYYFHMPLFFIISGFCYSFKDDYGQYVLTKVKRILIPYLVFSCIDLIPRHMFPNFINGTNPLTNDIFNIIFKGGQYWFLYVLFSIFIIFPLLRKISKNTIILMLLMIILRFFHFKNILLINSIIGYFFYFILGNLLKNVYSNKIKVKMSKLYILLSSSFVFVLMILIPQNIITSILKALIGCVMSYSIAVSIKARRVKSILKDFGDYSLQLYLLNGFMLVPARTIIIKILKVGEEYSSIEDIERFPRYSSE